MRIYVTNKDIKEGNSFAASSCAVARALQRKFPDKTITVGPYLLFIGGKDFKLPQHVKTFIYKWDRDRTSVKRINFKLPIEENV